MLSPSERWRSDVPCSIHDGLCVCSLMRDTLRVGGTSGETETRASCAKVAWLDYRHCAAPGAVRAGSESLVDLKGGGGQQTTGSNTCPGKSDRALIARYFPSLEGRLPDLLGGVVASFSVGVKIFHRRGDALVTELFFRVMWTDVVRPVGSYPVTNRVPGDLLVVRNG